MLQITLIGNIGNDAVIKNVNGKNCINFSVAVTKKFKDAAGTQKEKLTWVQCSHWTDRTAIAPYLKKGTQVMVQGEPEGDAYAKDGGLVNLLRCRVERIQLLGSPQNQQSKDSSVLADAPF